VLAWLRDSKTPHWARSTYASLLASCGKPADADELFQLLEKKENQADFSGYFLSILALKPKEYLPRVKAIASDPQARFLQERYSILRAIRMLEETKTAALTPAQRMDMVAIFLDQADMADFAVEEFRKWKGWDCTERILALLEKPSHKTPIIRKSILRFALQSPRPEAAAFVVTMRNEDREWVEDTEEFLKLEVEDAPK
jgi:hypothetical protein